MGAHREGNDIIAMKNDISFHSEDLYAFNLMSPRVLMIRKDENQ